MINKKIRILLSFILVLVLCFNIFYSVSVGASLSVEESEGIGEIGPSYENDSYKEDESLDDRKREEESKEFEGKSLEKDSIDSEPIVEDEVSDDDSYEEVVEDEVSDDDSYEEVVEDDSDDIRTEKDTKESDDVKEDSKESSSSQIEDNEDTTTDIIDDSDKDYSSEIIKNDNHVDDKDSSAKEDDNQHISKTNNSNKVVNKYKDKFVNKILNVISNSFKKESKIIDYIKRQLDLGNEEGESSNLLNMDENKNTYLVGNGVGDNESEFPENNDSVYNGNSNDEDIDLPPGFGKGDLIFMDSKKTKGKHVAPGKGNDHVAIYTGNTNENGYHEFYESVPVKGVWKTNTVTIKKWTNKTYFFAEVLADSGTKSRALQYIQDRMNDKPKDENGSIIEDNYQSVYDCVRANYDFEDPNDKYSNYFYCTELIWAAYMDASGGDINLDCNNNPKNGVWPSEILYDDDVVVYNKTLFLDCPDKIEEGKILSVTLRVGDSEGIPMTGNVIFDGAKYETNKMAGWSYGTKFNGGVKFLVRDVNKTTNFTISANKGDSHGKDTYKNFSKQITVISNEHNSNDVYNYFVNVVNSNNANSNAVNSEVSQTSQSSSENSGEGSQNSNNEQSSPEDSNEGGSEQPAYLISCTPDEGSTLTVDENESVIFTAYFSGGDSQYECVFDVGETTVYKTDYEGNGYEQYEHVYTQGGTYETSISLKDKGIGQIIDSSTTADVIVTANTNRNNPI